MAIENLDQLFSKVELYNDLKFKIYEDVGNNTLKLNKNELTRLCVVLGCSQKSIDSYCVFCKKEYSFDIELSSSMGNYVNASSCNSINFAGSTFIDLDDGKAQGFGNVISASSLYDFKICYLKYIFSCNKHDSHKYRMYLVVFVDKGNVTLRKIGQFPSMLDIWGFSFDRYKNQLDHFSLYDDFKKAELCMADGLYAGAYTYLRRVFEKILNDYTKGIHLEDNHVETKIKACINKFDDRIKPLLNNLYKILSKGIHELNDEESEDYYVYLRTIIEYQLEFIKEQNDRDVQTKELKQKIDSISEKLNK